MSDLQTELERLRAENSSIRSDRYLSTSTALAAGMLANPQLAPNISYIPSILQQALVAAAQMIAAVDKAYDDADSDGA